MIMIMIMTMTTISIMIMMMMMMMMMRMRMRMTIRFPAHDEVGTDLVQGECDEALEEVRHAAPLHHAFLSS